MVAKSESTAVDAKCSVVAGRGGVREIREILGDVLAQYGLRPVVAVAPRSPVKLARTREAAA